MPFWETTKTQKVRAESYLPEKDRPKNSTGRTLKDDQRDRQKYFAKKALAYPSYYERNIQQPSPFDINDPTNKLGEMPPERILTLTPQENKELLKTLVKNSHGQQTDRDRMADEIKWNNRMRELAEMKSRRNELTGMTGEDFDADLDKRPHHIELRRLQQKEEQDRRRAELDNSFKRNFDPAAERAKIFAKVNKGGSRKNKRKQKNNKKTARKSRVKRRRN